MDILEQNFENNFFQEPFQSVQENDAAFLLREYLFEHSLTNRSELKPIEENVRKPRESMIALVKEASDEMVENEISCADDYQALVNYLEGIDDKTYIQVRDRIMSSQVAY